MRARMRMLCAALLLACAPWGVASSEGAKLFSADVGAVGLRRPAHGLLAEGAHPGAAPHGGAFSELSGSAELRSRGARIDLGRLSAARLDIEEGRPARLGLNLFADTEFEAVLERAAPTASGYTLTGRLADEPLSMVVVAVNGEHAAGKVWSLGAIHSIRSTGGGAVIREVDPSGLPRCEGPVTPPSAHGETRGPAGSSAAALGGPNATVPAADFSAPADDGSVIDLLVVYPPFVRRAEGGVAAMRTLIDRDVAAANEAYQAGGAAQRVRLVAATEVDYETEINGRYIRALQSLSGELDGDMDEVHALRESYAADLVLLHFGEKRVAQAQRGGIAWLLVNQASEAGAPFGFSVASSSSFVHELGHNMGLAHEWADHPERNLLYPYSHGYEVRGDPQGSEPSIWRTIMHSEGFRINRFSNPRQRYPDESGAPLGVPGDDWPETDGPNGPADAVRSLNNTRRTVANFRAGARRCAYALSPAPSDLPAEGGEFKVRVRAAPGCPWTARTHDGFASVAEEGSSGLGDGEITYRIQRNGGWDREAALLVAGEVYPLKQKGSHAPTPVCERSPQVAMRIRSDLDRLSCEEVSNADLASIGELYMRYTEELKPGDFSGLSNLTVLRIDLANGLTLAPGVFDGLSNLRQLSFFGDHAMELPPGAFSGLPSLDELYISLDSDMPTTLHSGTFEGLSNLRELNIHGNFVELPIGAFAGLSNLRTLNIVDRKANLTTLPPGVFDGLPDLRFLELRGSSVQALRRGVFRGLANLLSIIMGASFSGYYTEMRTGGILESIEPGVFDGLSNLESLSLAHNSFRTLDPGVFEGLSNLIWLRLDNNRLTALSAGAFNGLDRLYSLWLQENHLTGIEPAVFDGMRALEALFLDGNRLTALQPGLLHGLFHPHGAGEETKLLVLSLRDNLLTHLSPNLFRKPAEAGVRDERSYETPEGRFWRMTNLMNLLLSGNRLTELPADLFRSAPFLDILEPDGNRKQSGPPVDFTGNPGAPFTLQMELVRLPAADSAVGRPLQVTVKVANGAPFPIAAKLSASGGALSDSGMLIPRGKSLGKPILVTPSGEGPVTVSLEAAASAFEHHHPDSEGHREWEAADWAGRSIITHPYFLGLQIVPQSPLVLNGFLDQSLALGEAAVLDLPSVFSYFLGQAAYAVRSSDPTVAAVQVDGDELTVRANATGAATVTVVATGRNGRRMERRFAVRGLAPPQAVGEIADLSLVFGGFAEVGLAGKFRDADSASLTYAARSTDSAVAAVSVDGGALGVAGGEPGSATVVVTATDPDGLSATLAFTVTVKRPVASRWGGWRSVLLQQQPPQGDGDES